MALDATAVTLPLSPEVKQAIASQLTAWGDVPVAVRSSAAAEDGVQASWAGQFETVLGAVGLDAVEAAIKTCVAGATSERVLAYADMHGLQTGAMAIVLQKLAPGTASGVVFSRDPQDPERTLISVGLGLGEGVVQGLVSADTVHVNDAGVVSTVVAHKDSAVRMVDGTPQEVSVETGQDDPALTDVLARTLYDYSRTLERELGCPQDVEFTVVDGRVVLLQTRPITVPIPVGQRLLWDNSNIVESYSGVTSPLTFSFASRAYTIVYQLFCGVMGVKPSVIRENEPMFKRMIGLINGRIYYNLNAWYRLIQLLPAYNFNRGAMETMMGVSEVASDDDAGASQARWVAGLEVGRLVFRLGGRLFRLRRDAERFREKVATALREGKAMGIAEMRADALLRHYETIERELLWAWTPPLVNDFFCMIFYKLLEKRCQEITGDPKTQLHNELIAGEDLASAAPAKDLLALAHYSARVPELSEALLSGAEDTAILSRLRKDIGFEERFSAWLAAFGDRSPDELKLESPTLDDTPEFILGTLKAFARDPGAVREFGVVEKETRRKAEARLATVIPGGLKGRLFRFTLGQARARITMREALRFDRTRVFGHVRRIFRAFGNRYVEAGVLDTRDDIFYLTVDEVLGFARGTAVSTNLRGLVGLRRVEFDAHAEATPPDERFWTWGAVHIANRFQRKKEATAIELDGDALVGTACSPGIVIGIARVVTDPRKTPDLNGGILVAHRTDPGWVPLYPTASAILVERGSLLSHSAVVARELGLPAVVGARGLLDWVKDGERIGLDGSTGRIWKEPLGDEEPEGNKESQGE
ncbi:MAG: pyruvate,water dikinase [Myxococcota bacterium]